MNGPKYSEGNQPCQNFRPDEMEVYWWGVAVHECPICKGSRIFCGNCKRDHHKGGWEHCSDHRPHREVSEEMFE